MASGITADHWSSVLRGFLVPVSLVYAGVQQVRAELYRVGVLKTRKLARPVISIGNLAAGGTGKTPVTAHIARLLMGKGLKVAVLSRGYGGTLEGQTTVVSDGFKIALTADQCGDEPFLLAKSIPGLAVVIGSDRYAAGQLALQVCKPDIFLLDDGFQHLRLQRDLNILLLDGTRPLGNGWTLPAGLLRESQRAAERADFIIYTRCQDVSVRRELPKKPHCLARHQLADLISLAGEDITTFDELYCRRVIAFAGIAEPEFFFDSLRTLGLNVVATLPFPDHAVYDRERCCLIDVTCRTFNADYVVTTEKDGVKLKKLPNGLVDKILLARLELVIDDQGSLMSQVCNLLQKQ
jgi:tetraacyldisaccharide 4'-kinase